MLENLCRECRNYFVRGIEDIHPGTYTVEGGIMSPVDFLADGQYYRIVGSVNCDGIYRWPEVPLYEGALQCVIWAMRVPSDFVDLALEVESWCKSEEGKPTAFTSESFGGYSYSRAMVNGKLAGWRVAFADRLAPFRRARVL